MTTQDAMVRLREPFPKHKIQHLDTGKGFQLAYVSHADVTERLLDIDPEWNWEPVAFDDRGLPAFDQHGGLWIKLTILGVTRYGYGEPQGRDEWDRVKGAIGNAIRVAAMRFGVGLHLWQKEATADTSVFDRIAAKAIETAHRDEPSEWTRPDRQRSHGGRPASPQQIKLVQAKFRNINIHSEAEACQALTEFLKREVKHWSDLYHSDIDLIVRAGEDGLQQSYFASMGMELIKDTPADDPWSIK